jgi:hypothetical protein
MNVSTGLFELLEPGSIPGFELRLYAIGSGFERRAAPLLARVGDVVVQQIFIAPDGTGFSGFLAEAPQEGDRLFVRYADEKEFSTDVVFGSSPNA